MTTTIANAVDEYALSVFRNLSNEGLVKNFTYFTKLAEEQALLEPKTANGALALRKLTLQVIRERGLNE